jgi:hypothetical protein
MMPLSNCRICVTKIKEQVRVEGGSFVLQVEIPSILDLPRIWTILTIRLSRVIAFGAPLALDLGAKLFSRAV